MGRTGVSRNIRLIAVAVLAVLSWTLAGPRCVDAASSEKRCDAAVAVTDDCGGTATDARACEPRCGCPCPCSEVPGFRPKPEMQPPSLSSTVDPTVGTSPLSFEGAPPVPVPIGG